MQELNGKPVLTIFNGTVFDGGTGYGSVLIYDDTYTLIHDVTLSDPYFRSIPGEKYPSFLDLHESELTPNGTILCTATNVTRADLTSVGGPADGWVVDSFVYEIDVATNEVVFSWSSLDHEKEAPFDESFISLNSTASGNGTLSTEAWNWFHINSVAKYNGNYLLSSYLMCTIYYINPAGEVIWQLQGQTGGDFTLGADASFCFQHDVRAQHLNDTHMTLTMHDNAVSETDLVITNKTLFTRGLEMTLDLEARTTTLERALWNHEKPVYAKTQGNYQPLPDGHVLMGQGDVPVVEEYNAQNELIMDFWFGVGYNTQSYRAFRNTWEGHPLTKPLATAYSTSATTSNYTEMPLTEVYMSWNGATEVVSWNIYCGASQNTSQMTMAMNVPRNGFETKAVLTEDAQYVQVEAVERDGKKTRSTLVPVQ